MPNALADLLGGLIPQGVGNAMQRLGQQPPSLLDIATAQYPYLADKGIAMTYQPDPKTLNQLEFYAPGETGDEDNPRPKSLPMDKVGLAVYKPTVSPSDVLADYVSHFGVQHDPKLSGLYNQFAASLDPKMMHERYQYDVAHEGENRPFDQWAQAVGVPAAFRGYTFKQWPDAFNKHFYSKAQTDILDAVRAVVGFKDQ